MPTTDYQLLPSGFYRRISDNTGPYVKSAADTWALAATGTAGGGGAGGGDASAANQATEIAQITALLAQTDGVETSLSNIDANAGAATDAVVAGGAPGTLSAKFRRLTADIAALLLRWPAALGTAADAAALPVAWTTEGKAQLGSLTEGAPATDTASSGLNGRLQRIAQRFTSLIALFTATAAADTNRLPIDSRDGLAITGTATSAAVLFTQDMLGYESLGLQVTSAGTTCTITYEQSEDQTTWSVAPGLNVASTTGALASTSTTAQALRFPRQLRYFRARVSTYTSGTVTVQGTLSKVPTSLIGAVNIASVGATAIPVAGPAAHAAAISGNPVRLGARGRTSTYAAVANDQVADLVSTLVGALVQKPYSIPEADWGYPAGAGGIVNSAAAVTMAAAAGAGIRNYLTGLQISAEALGAATELAVRDGPGGTVLWRTKIGTAGLAAQSISFPTPLKGTANTLLEVITLTASVTGAVFVNAQGYTAP